MATVAVPNVSVLYGQGSFSAPRLVETRQTDQYTTEYIYEITCIPAAGWEVDGYYVTQTATTEYIDPPYPTEVDTEGPVFREVTGNVIRLESSNSGSWSTDSIFYVDYPIPGSHYRWVVTAFDVQIRFRRLPVQIHLLGKPADGSHGTTHGYFRAKVSNMVYSVSDLVYTDRGPSSETTMTDFYDSDPAASPASLTLTAYPLVTGTYGGDPDNVFRAWIVNGTVYTDNPKTISLDGYNGTTVEVVGWFGCNKILKEVAGGDVLKDSVQANAILRC